MAMNKTNRATVEIDEDFLLQSIKNQDIGTGEAGKVGEKVETVKIGETGTTTPLPPETTEPVAEKPKEAKEPSRRKKTVNADYSSLFLQSREFKARQCVYISQRIHATISEIVKVISDREITVGGYIDSILTEHLEAHRDEITELYNSELSKKSGKSLIEF